MVSLIHFFLSPFFPFYHFILRLFLGKFLGSWYGWQCFFSFWKMRAICKNFLGLKFVDVFIDFLSTPILNKTLYRDILRPILGLTLLLPLTFKNYLVNCMNFHSGTILFYLDHLLWIFRYFFLLTQRERKSFSTYYYQDYVNSFENRESKCKVWRYFCKKNDVISPSFFFFATFLQLVLAATLWNVMTIFDEIKYCLFRWIFFAFDE